MIKKLFSIFLLLVNLHVVFANVAPILTNFRVEDSEKSRVYFDSSEPITASNVTGFTITYKTITGLHINNGSTTGHYFTVSSAFSFWDNNSIRYDGGSDLRDVDGGKELHNFTLSYIQNNIPEPSATLNTFYVDAATGSDANDGRSESSAFKTIKKGVESATAGSTVYVKAGQYGFETRIDVSVSGTKDSPIKIIGYKSTPGDITSMYYSFGQGDLNTSEMPTLTSTNAEYAFYMNSYSGNRSDYVIIRNFQVQGYLRGVNSRESIGIIVDNCLFYKNTLEHSSGRAVDFSINTKTDGGSNWANGYSRILNSTSVDASNTAFGVWSSGNLIEGSKSYSTITTNTDDSQDYYFDIYGSFNIVRNCHAERANVNVKHEGHAYNLKAHPYDFAAGQTPISVSYNLIEKNFCKGIRENYMVRNTGANYNVFKDNVGIGFTSAKNERSYGIVIRGGASHNVFERMDISTCDAAVEFRTNQENRDVNWNHTTYAAESNVIRNSKFDNVYYLFRFNNDHNNNSGTKVPWTLRNNLIANCTFNDIDIVARTYDAASDYVFTGNKVVNSIFTNVGKRSMNETSNPWAYETIKPFQYDHSNFFGGVGELPWATNTISGNPNLDANLKPTTATPEDILDGGIDVGGIKYDFENMEREPGKFSVGAYDNEMQTTGSVSPNVSICEGENTVLVASGGDSYIWNTGETTESISVSPTETTTYTVTVTEGQNTGTHEVTVTVDVPPSVDAGVDQSICEGETVTLTATGNGDFLWSTGDTTASITVNPTSTTTYSVTATNACSTDATDEVVVTVIPSVNLDAGSDVAICQGESITLTATGTGPFNWSTGETTASITVSPNSSTTYTVSSDNGSCSETDEVEVTVNTPPSVNAGADRVICDGESVTLTATGNGDFLWSTGETTATITVDPNETTTYSVTASNSCNADATDEVVVTVNPSTNLDAGSDVAICQGESVTLTATGTGPFSWSTGATSASISVSPNSSTIYTVTSDNGTCSETDEVEVTVNTSPSVDAGPDRSICQGETVTLTATGNGDFLWSTGETSPSITVSPNETSTYSVTTTSAGCQSTAVDYVDVVVGENPNLSTTNDVTIQRGENITLEAFGDGNFFWNTGATTSSIAVSPTNTTSYTVTLTSEGGCSDKSTIVVTVVEAADGSNMVAFAGEDATICSGDEIVLTASGGDTFLWNTGETTRSITVAPSESTIFSVQVTQEDYSDTAYVKVTVDNGCAQATKEMVVYPIPTEGLINIDLLGYDNNTNFRVYDSNGNMVLQDSINNQNKVTRLKHNIDLSRLARGVYYISVSNKGDRTTKRIVLL